MTDSPPAPPRSPWPAAVCAATALGLVLLAGCFLAGVTAIVAPAAFGAPQHTHGITDSQRALLLVLYTATAACFTAALAALTLAYRKLP